MYITAFASISSMALEIEALSFVVLENFKPGRNSVSCSPPPTPYTSFLQKATFLQATSIA